MNFEVIDVNDQKWDSYVKSAHFYDFHHTSTFHDIETTGENVAKMFVAKDGVEFVCLPIIIRPILGTDFYDATSVYGYAGPIASCKFSEVSESLLDFFKMNLIRYCTEHQIISVFSRLHPCVEQDFALSGLGKVVPLNKTVAIDLTIPLDEQRQKYRRVYKSQIKKLKGEKGYTVSVAEGDCLDIFKEIYFETMDRVGAQDRYYFSDEYLRTMINNPCFDTKVFIAYNAAGEPVSAAMFTITDQIMQYHLCGTKNSALRDAPIKYIMDEARLLANEMGLQKLHLGGGLDGSDEDSLFKFKSGFSKKFCQFKVWNWVVNQSSYDTLVTKNLGAESQREGSQFFPLYREAG